MSTTDQTKQTLECLQPKWQPFQVEVFGGNFLAKRQFLEKLKNFAIDKTQVKFLVLIWF